MTSDMLDLTLFGQTARDAVVRGLALPGASAAERRGALLRLFAFGRRSALAGNLWQAYLAQTLLSDENPWSLACEGRGDCGGSLSRLACLDAEKLQALFALTFPELPAAAAEEILHFEPQQGAEPSFAAGRIDALRAGLAAARDADAFASALAEGYRSSGCGIFALCHAFRTEQGGLVPVADVNRVSFRDLTGYEDQKKTLAGSIEAFLRGEEANHILLYGDAGTGKSTCVRALLTEYEEGPLRLVELTRPCFAQLPSLLARLAGRNCRFLLFIDDLSFEESETEYKALKAAMEGGVQTMPANVRICATSNRRHLVREVWKDRSDMEYEGDLHRSDTVEEKLSLAGRFGVQIRFDRPGRKLYHDIVAELAAQRGIVMDEEVLFAQADTWALRSGGLTGRTGRQFIDDLCGRLGRLPDPAGN